MGDYGGLALSFEANAGQSDSLVKFVTRGRGYTVFFTPSDTVFSLREAADQVRVIKMKLAGGNPGPDITALEELPGKVNYFVGRDPQRWQAGIPAYARIVYRDIYPGIDLVYRGSRGQLEYDFVVSPGANPGGIRLRFEGADSIGLAENGDLVLRVGDAVVRQMPPLIYQPAGDGRAREEFRPIAGSFVLSANDEVGFQVASYDATKPLVIDPVFIYSTFLGGSDRDTVNGITIGADESVYVTGTTSSDDFPTHNPMQEGRAGNFDLFVTKLSPDGAQVAYSTYLGGSSGDIAYGIAVDGSGNVYLTGSPSRNFPTTEGAFNTTHSGATQAFVLKLDAQGRLAYSGFLGGGRNEKSYGIAVDAEGNAWVTGWTDSQDFPAKGFQQTFGGYTDAFVAKISANGSQLLFSSYLGGSGTGAAGADRGVAIAVDQQGNAYVTGSTGSQDFPTTPGAFRTALSGPGHDVFVTKFSAAGGAPVYSTYLGGDGADTPFGIAVDAAGHAYISGETEQTNYPTTAGVFQPKKAGGPGARSSFVTKLSADGRGLVYSSFLGGSGVEHASGIAVDVLGSAYLAGWTASPDFPVVNPLPGGNANRNGDVYVAKVNNDGSALLYSTYLGGTALDRSGGDAGDPEGNLIAVDRKCQAYVGGRTRSADFPTHKPLQSIYGGGFSDGFVTKIGPVADEGQPIIDCGGLGLAGPSPAGATISPDSRLTIVGRNLAAQGTDVQEPERDADGNASLRLAETCVEIKGDRARVFSVRPDRVSAQPVKPLEPGYASVRVIRSCGTDKEQASEEQRVLIPKPQ